MSAIEVFQRLAAPLVNRIHGMVARGVVRAADDAPMAQTLQISVLAGELIDGVEHLQPYGFSAVPEPGAEAVVLAIGGNRAHPLVVVAEDRRYRPTGLAEGEVVVYDKTGSRIHLKADGSIELTPSSGEIVLAGNVTLSGNLTVSGNVTADGEVEDSLGTLDSVRQAYNAHAHKENGAGGGVTDPPLPQL